MTDKTKNIPYHVGIIIDGNRRWAVERALPHIEGHKYGVRVVEKFLDWCFDLDIKTITVYIFSNENFGRPENEVRNTLNLIEEETAKLLKNEKIQLVTIKKSLEDFPLLQDEVDDLVDQLDKMWPLADDISKSLLETS